MYTRKLPSGVWQATAKHNGLVRTATAPTKSQAIQKGAELLVELGGSTIDIAPQATVAVVLAEHRARAHESWSAQYLADFDRMTRRLPDDFAARPAGGVHPADVDALYRRLHTAGMSPHRLQRLHGFLSGAFRRAATNGWIRSSPCTRVTPPTAQLPDLVVPTAAQVAAIIAATPEGSRRLFVRTAAITGARRGELVGLQWDDLAVDRHEVVIRRTRARGAKGEAYTGIGKTGRRGHRVLTLDPVTVAGLHAMHLEQRAQATANRLPSPVWIFTLDAGATPWHPDHATDVFNTARTDAKVPGVRLHDLRHYVATSMLQDGESPIDVAGQLGDTVPTVLRTYAHYLPGRGRDAALRRAAALG
jgi:integrase